MHTSVAVERAFLTMLRNSRASRDIDAVIQMNFPLICLWISVACNFFPLNLIALVYQWRSGRTAWCWAEFYFFFLLFRRICHICALLIFCEQFKEFAPVPTSNSESGSFGMCGVVAGDFVGIRLEMELEMGRKLYLFCAWARKESRKKCGEFVYANKIISLLSNFHHKHI